MDGAIFDVGLKGARQCEANVRNGIFALERGFKDAMAVGIVACLHVKGVRSARLQVNGLNGFNVLRHFLAVCPNVLHGGGTYLARYVRKVFKAVKIVGQRPKHKVVPHLACAHAHHCLVWGLLKHLDALNGRVKYRAAKVAHEHEVASGADVQVFLFRQSPRGDEVLQLLGCGVFKKIIAMDVEAKSVVW